LLTVATALAALTIGCSGGDGDSEASTPDTTATSVATAATGGDNGNTDNGEAREIEVSMQDNFFEPTEIRIKAGETVKIEAKNDGTAIHNMIVSDVEGQTFQSDALVNPADSSEFEVTVQTPGSYEFFCAFHLPGMVGTLIVE